MPATVHELDPGWDTLIILKNPLLEFVVWEKPGAEKYATAGAQGEGGCAGTEDCDTGDSEDDAESLHKDDHISAEGEEVHYRVSSAHLMLASRTFRTMMGGQQWRESRRGADGNYRIIAQQWDAEAFLTLLNIFHLRHNSVPEKIGLASLAKMATLVDYYECEEAVVVHTSMWIQAVNGTDCVPTTYCRNLVLWILVSRVFGLSKAFESSTRVAITYADEPIRTMGLAIWPDTIERIDSERKRVISELFSFIYDLLDEYRSVNYVCPQDVKFSFSCGAILLGGLMEEMERAGIPLCRSSLSYTSTSFAALRTQINSIRSPNMSWKDDHHSCDFSRGFADQIKLLETTLTGLEMKQSYTRIPLCQPGTSPMPGIKRKFSELGDETRYNSVLDMTLVLGKALDDFALWDPKPMPIPKARASANRNSAVKEIEVKTTVSVSSRHLFLASEVLKREMTAISTVQTNNDSGERTDAESNHAFERWDGDAFRIFLDTLHLRRPRTPAFFPADLFAKIATLADHYKCEEAVGVWIKIWIEEESLMDWDRENSWNPFDRDLVLCMYVAWVFQLPREFSHCTRIAMMHLRDESMQTLLLPMAVVAGKIEQARWKAIYNLTDRLSNQLHVYSDNRYTCPGGEHDSFSCACTMYGALAMGMAFLRIPLSENLTDEDDFFKGESFNDICYHVRNTETPAASCGHNYDDSSDDDDDYIYTGTRQHCCSLKTVLRKIVLESKDAIQGLDLESVSRK